jgi:hypothetical protein
MLWLIRAIGVISILFIVTAVLMEIVDRGFTPVSGTLLGKFKKRFIAMEFVRSRDEIKAVVGELGDPIHQQDRDTMRCKLRLDFLFIATYGLLFIAVGILLTQRPPSWAFWLGIIAAGCGTAAAVSDVVENIRTLHVLDLPLARTGDEMAQAIRQAAMVKWTLSFLTIGMLSATFFLQGRWISWPSLIGLFFAASALWGMFAFVLKNEPQMAQAMTLAALATLILMVVSLIWPHKLL